MYTICLFWPLEHSIVVLMLVRCHFTCYTAEPTHISAQPRRHVGIKGSKSWWTNGKCSHSLSRTSIPFQDLVRLFHVSFFFRENINGKMRQINVIKIKLHKIHQWTVPKWSPTKGKHLRSYITAWLKSTAIISSTRDPLAKSFSKRRPADSKVDEFSASVLELTNRQLCHWSGFDNLYLRLAFLFANSSDVSQETNTALRATYLICQSTGNLTWISQSSFWRVRFRISDPGPTMHGCDAESKPKWHRPNQNISVWIFDL